MLNDYDIFQLFSSLIIKRTLQTHVLFRLQNVRHIENCFEGEKTEKTKVITKKSNFHHE